MLPAPLPAGALRPRFTSADLPVETTEALEPLEDPVGQERAVEALRFGVEMPSDGYNLFVMGPPGVGRHTLVRAFLEARARDGKTPGDVCYVHDFAHPERPRALLLPPGRGKALRDDMAQLVRELGTVLPGAFESEEFAREKKRIEQEFKTKHEARLGELKARADARGVALLSTPMGFAIAPVQGGQLVEPEAFEKLPQDQRDRFNEAIEKTQEELRGMLEDLPRIQAQMRATVRAFVHGTVTAAIRHHLQEVRDLWK